MKQKLLAAMILAIILVSTFASACAAPKWVLHLEGAIPEDITDSKFVAGAKLGHHGISWQDDQNRTWEGIPLWLLVGRVDDDKQHKSGAFNDRLADVGYEVQLISTNGNMITLNSKDIKRNNTLLVTYQIDGKPVDQEFFPLRLVGPNLEEQQMIGQIIKIKILFP